MSDIFKDIEEEAEKKSVTEADLQIISKLAKEQKILEADAEGKHIEMIYEFCKNREISVPTLEVLLKRRKEDLNKIKLDELPEAMINVGMKSFTLVEGGEVTIKSDVAVSVKKENKEKFYTWMIKKGFQALVKNKVEVRFPMEGRKSSKSFIKYLKRYYADREKCIFTEVEDIHSQTLKAHIKKEMEKGTNFPEGLVTIHQYKIATIK